MKWAPNWWPWDSCHGPFPWWRESAVCRLTTGWSAICAACEYRHCRPRDILGIVRLIADDVDKASHALRSADLPFSTVDVLGVEVSDEPGALGKVAVLLAEKSINVDYAYVTVASSSGNAMCIFKVTDPADADIVLSSD